MGGGDLNLKKSWHPQTLRNVEKVWKAEQKAAAEAKKIDQLRKELEDERAREEMQQYAVDQGIVKKKDQRLDWMYSTPGQVNHEEYLLGKMIDKKVDPLAQKEDQDELIPGSSFASSSQTNNANDLATKVREDPLFKIKKKEDEKKKELLNNPVRMKQLQLMIRASMQEKETGKKEKKKKKKERKEKQREKKSQSYSSSDEEQKSRWKKHKEFSRSPSPGKHHKNQDKMDRRNNHHKSRSHKHSNHQTKDHQQDRTLHSKSRQKSYNTDRHHSKRPNDYERERSRTNTPNSHIMQKHSRSPSSSPVRHKKSLSEKHRSPSPSFRNSKKKSEIDRKQKSPDEIRRKRESSHRRSRSSSPSYKRRRSPPQAHQRGSNITRKLDPEELERRRAEMMGNAVWRDEQRKQNVAKYREEEAQEDQELNKNNKQAADFLQPMKLQSFSSNSTSSVEDRIKRNIHSIQRTPAALETFLRK